MMGTCCRPVFLHQLTRAVFAVDFAVARLVEQALRMRQVAYGFVDARSNFIIQRPPLVGISNDLRQENHGKGCWLVPNTGLLKKPSTVSLSISSTQVMDTLLA